MMIIIIVCVWLIVQEEKEAHLLDVILAAWKGLQF